MSSDGIFLLRQPFLTRDSGMKTGSVMIKHFVLWTFLVPWVASTIWLSIDSVLFGRLQLIDIFVSFAVCGFLLAPLGVLWCMLITIPVGVFVYLTFVLRPAVLSGRYFRIWFSVATSIGGAVWAKYVAGWLSLGSAEGWSLIIVGFAAGVTLGLGTIRIWSGELRRGAESRHDERQIK